MTDQGLTLEEADDVVAIRRGEMVEPANWMRVKAFWLEYALDTAEADAIHVPLAEFYFRRFWFRPNWIDLGFQIETSETLTLAVERVRKQEGVFEDLSQRGYSDTSKHLLGEIDKLGLKRSPTDSQLRNIASLLASPHGANFSVPGAGKTFTSLVVFAVLQSRAKIARALIICPKSAFEAWTSEPGLSFDQPPIVEIYDGPIIDPQTQVLVVNFEKIENPERQKQLRHWLSEADSMLIIDEAHRIKRGSGGRRWQACIQVASAARRVDLLTGTPMPQSFDDLRNLLAVSWRTIPKNQLSDTTLANMKPGGVFVRTTKSELGLPEIKVLDVPIRAGKAQKEIYDAMSRMYRGTLSLSSEDQSTLRKKGRAVMTLLAAASNPALIRGDSKEALAHELRWPPSEIGQSADLIEVLQSYMSHEIPAKYEWVSRYIKAASRDSKKTLIWSSFVGNLELLAEVLKPYQPAVVHGSVNREDRDAEIARFRYDSSCHVLLTNPQTLGEGISLHTVAHEAIFLDRTYNAAQYLQALDRIHRLGLAPETLTTIYLLQTEGTVDERVGVRLEQKIDLLSSMLNDAGLRQVSIPQPDEEEGLIDSLGLDQFDLDDLLSHLLGNKSYD